ncbi:cyclic pyranopterin monophosphate synthase MoaC [Allosphingosinicella sp.]|jgi:cyclic pyranopterin phosphate synthase|uniref:cyclic pyranopterin monophosphate synthase MoaC n=1 Tax=Allosphingosinicella sp. TaxID=2823234 RepID=UPI002F0AA823
MAGFTHFDENGRPHMVDVSAKPETERFAAARGFVRMDEATLALVRSGLTSKGDVARIAELAGTMAAKRTADLIPLCHPLPLTAVSVAVEPDESLPGLAVTAEARTTGRTGVEMEALTAVAVACLTIYDMLKSGARGMTIERIELTHKSGGASGGWQRE